MKYKALTQIMPAAAVLVQCFGIDPVLGQSAASLTLTPGQQSQIANRLALSGTQTVFTNVNPVIDPFYAGSYAAVDLGAPAFSGAGNIGGLAFSSADSNVLLIDVNTFQASAELEAVTVIRESSTHHITGFSGVGTHAANAPYIDGGLQYGLGGVLFYTAYGPNQLGQFKPGSVDPDKVVNLTPLGVSSSVGPIRFVPLGFGGAGGLKVVSWDAKIWYSLFLSPDGTGTYNVSAPTKTIAMPNLNWEGMVYIAGGNPLFPNNSILINADLAESVYSFQVDSDGNPITSTQRLFMKVGDPVGMTADPVTGDILISTEQGPVAHHITLVKGFAPYTPPATPVLTTTKAAYGPGETIVVNYSNASGAAHDWVGLYSPGVVNDTMTQWYFTNGSKDSQKGTAGLINGSLSFPGGMITPGTYEARLFFDASYNLQATVSFNVQAAPPGQASAPNPASGSTGVSVNPTLTWTAGAGATSHDVYFGTNSTISSGDFRGGQSGTVYSPLSLNPFTTYYWRIDEINSVGATAGPVWSFTTASSPDVTTGKSTYSRAEQVSVNFLNASGDTHDWIGLFAAGTANTAYLQWYFVDGTQAGSTSGIINGTVSFPSGLPNAGNYEARLFSAGSYTLEASTPFSVQAPTPTISTTQGNYTRGSTITANFTNAAGGAKDWIGLFAVGAANTAFLKWVYTDGTTTGTAGLTNGSVNFLNGLSTAPGTYEVRLFFNDSFVVQATNTFNLQ